MVGNSGGGGRRGGGGRSGVIRGVAGLSCGTTPAAVSNHRRIYNVRYMRYFIENMSRRD